MIEEIVETRRFEFLDLYEAQNESSRRLLRAIAVAGPVAEPLAGDFIVKHGLRATSSVASALKDLLGRDLLYKMPTREYIVYDRFFGTWLRSLL